MNRIPLNYTQRRQIHEYRRTVEAKIRTLKKELRGKPHDLSKSPEQQSALHALKHQASCLYTLIAGAFGREHFKDPARVEAALKWLRENAKFYETYYKAKRAPQGMEVFGLMLVEAETPAPATAPAA